MPYEEASPTTPDAQVPGNPDAFCVRLASGDVCVLSLDELDAAYQDGRIDEHTPVLPFGATDWTRLGALAGLDEDDATVPSPHPAVEDPRARLPSVVVRVSTPTGPIAPRLPPQAMPSVRPFTTDLDATEADDLPPFARRPTKRWKLVAGVVGAGAAFGLILALISVSGGPGAAASTATASMVDPTLPPVVPAPAPAPPPVAAPAPAETASVDARLTDAQKKALADANRARAAQHKVSSVRSAPRTNGKNVFHKGGSKYDPLNAAL